MSWLSEKLIKYGLKEKPRPRFLIDPKEPIELAWIDHTGMEYYQFADPMNTPCLRGLNAITFFRELQMMTTREHLEKEVAFLTEQVKKAKASLSGENGKINLVKTIEALNEIEAVQVFRKERMQMLFAPDLAYKLASVVFFDQSENPYQYDAEYGKKKIARWKENEEIGAFFLREPIVRLMPYMEQLGENIPTYSMTAMKILEKQFEKVSAVKSKKRFTTAHAAN